MGDGINWELGIATLAGLLGTGGGVWFGWWLGRRSAHRREAIDTAALLRQHVSELRNLYQRLCDEWASEFGVDQDRQNDHLAKMSAATPVLDADRLRMASVFGHSKTAALDRKVRALIKLQETPGKLAEMDALVLEISDECKALVDPYIPK